MESTLGWLIALSVTSNLARQAFPIGPAIAKWLSRAEAALMFAALLVLIGAGMS